MVGDKMEYDSFIIYDGEKQITIYPLLEINENNKKYIIYTNNVSNIEFNNLFVGEITSNNELLPIDNNQLAGFEEILKNTLNNLQNR